MAGLAGSKLFRVLLVAAGVCGFSWCATSAQQVAITFDDLPAHSALPPGTTRIEVATATIAALKEAGIPPIYGFVNAEAIERQPGDAVVLDDWRKAGNLLGNHAWSHMNLNTHSLEDWEKDVLRNEPAIESRMKGADWHWLRFPYLAQGDTEEKREGVRAFLAQHGYRIAGTTMSFGDYLWNEPYARCSEKKDAEAIAFLEASYLLAAKSELHYVRAISRSFYGHNIPYVLLMHIGAFDARMLPRLLRMYKEEGVTFVTLEEAEKDPFYLQDTDLKRKPASDSLEGAAAAKQLPLPAKALEPPKLDNLCR